MKTLIAFATKHGATKNIAEKIAGKLDENVNLYNITEKNEISLSNYDKIIIGGSIYAGRIRKEVKEFCSNHIDELLEKDKIGLFISCMGEGEKAEEQLKDNFPDKLYKNAVATGALGGEFDFNKLSFFEKLVVKMVSGVKESQSNILEENIVEFCKKLSQGKEEDGENSL
ncbi:MAG: flavodoxin domain-containing protein [bacterium]